MSEKSRDHTAIRRAGAAEGPPLRRVGSELVIEALTPAVERLAEVARAMARERKATHGAGRTLGFEPTDRSDKPRRARGS
jgi:hypothetical protein